MSHHKKLAILVGGGPAPGINSVIGAATIRAVLESFVPLSFVDLVDPGTGRARVRMVDIRSTRYAIARRSMIRLRRDDFDDPHELARFAATCGLSLQDFRSQFEYLISSEPPPLILEGLGPPATSAGVEALRVL